MRDAGQLVKLWRRPEVYSRTSDDFCEPAHIDKYICAVLSSPGINLIGSNPKTNSFLFIPMNGAHATIHVSILDIVNEKHILARSAVGWIFNNTDIKSITAMIPRDPNSLNTRLFAVACGMKPSGLLEKSFKRNNEYLDQQIYHATQQDFLEMEEEIWLAQQQQV